MLTHRHRTILGDIPPDWDAKPLKQLITEHFAGDWGDDEGEQAVAVLRSTNFTNDGQLDFSDIARRYFPKAQADHFGLLKSDLLVERSGGGPEQPVGRIGFIDRDMPGSTVSNFVQVLRADPEKVDASFLRWVLIELQRTGIVERVQQQSTQMRNLNWRDYQRLMLPWPEINEQHRIAAALNLVDDAILKSRADLDATRELKRSLMDRLLTLGKSGNHHPLETKFGAVPSHWTVKTLSEHAGSPACVKTGPFGAQLPPEAFDTKGMQFVNITDIGEGVLAFAETLFIRDSEAKRLADYQLKPGDLIFSRVASVGRVALIPEGSGPYMMSSNCVRLRAGTAFAPKFLCLLFLGSPFIKRQVAAMSTGGARPIVTPRFLRRLLVAKPPLDEQQEIVQTVDAAIEVEIAKSDVVRALQKTKISLLHSLLTGRIRIPAGAIHA